MADLRKQVEELLGICEVHALYRYDEVVIAFPDIARHYLALLDENERLRKAVKAYMFVEQTDGGRNPHRPGTNKHTAFEFGRAALARADALTGEKP